MTAKKQDVPKVEPPTLGFATATDFEVWVADHCDDPAGVWLQLAGSTRRRGRSTSRPGSKHDAWPGGEIGTMRDLYRIRSTVLPRGVARP